MTSLGLTIRCAGVDTEQGERRQQPEPTPKDAQVSHGSSPIAQGGSGHGQGSAIGEGEALCFVYEGAQGQQRVASSCSVSVAVAAPASHDTSVGDAV
jgi:hypothetical protein